MTVTFVTADEGGAAGDDGKRPGVPAGAPAPRTRPADPRLRPRWRRDRRARRRRLLRPGCQRRRTRPPRRLRAELRSERRRRRRAALHHRRRDGRRRRRGSSPASCSSSFTDKRQAHGSVAITFGRATVRMRSLLRRGRFLRIPCAAFFTASPSSSSRSRRGARRPPTSRRASPLRRRVSSRARPASSARRVSTSSSAEAKVPGMVRRDCAQWQREVICIHPDRRVRREGQAGSRPVRRHGLDGRRGPPQEARRQVRHRRSGPHTFRFEIAGRAALEPALVKEGEKSRVITVTFDEGVSERDPHRGVITRRWGQRSPTTNPAKKDTRSRPGSSSALACGVVIAVVISSSSSTRPVAAPTRRLECARNPAECPDADLPKRQEAAGTAEAQPVLGLVAAPPAWRSAAPASCGTSSSPRPHERRPPLHPLGDGQGSGGGTLGATFETGLRGR